MKTQVQLYKAKMEEIMHGMSGEQVKLSMIELQDKDKQLLQEKVAQLESQCDMLNAKLLIEGQIDNDKKVSAFDQQDMLQEEIEELKENLERKEYLLQFNEQKYFQYEKVLRDLILNKQTPDPVKDQLRVKIETQELFVPKEERKISNVVHTNRELLQQLEMLKKENLTMRNQLEEILERGKMAKQQVKLGHPEEDKFINNFMNQTIEVLSIF